LSLCLGWNKISFITNVTQAKGVTQFLIIRHIYNICEKRLLASSCTSIPMEQFCSHLTDFQEIWCFRIFWKARKKIPFSLKHHNNNNHYLPQTTTSFFIISHSILLIMRNVSDKSCRENQNKHLVFNIFLYHAVYVIMWKNDVELGRWQNSACAWHAG
jgi:hypothetical protein